MREVVRGALVVVVGSAVALGCRRTEPRPRDGDPAAPQATAGTGSGAASDPAAAAACEAALAKAEIAPPLTWIHDDYPGALACAKAKHLPLVVDLWAPWCHTCLSMQSTVFRDPSFADDLKRFVFVALDTDKPENEQPVGKLPMSGWPTFYVLAPDETVLARYVGSASTAQFHGFMDAGAAAFSGTAAGPEQHLLAAERATAVKDFAVADQELTAALAGAPQDWARRPDVLVSLINAKQKRGDLDGCLKLGETAMDQTGNSASASDFLYGAVACARQAIDQAPTDQGLAARVTALRTAAIARWQALVDDTSAPLSVDDRSDALANLRETLDALGKQPEARVAAERQATLLDQTAEAAKTPLDAMTYLWPRSEVYAYLGKPLALVPALQKLADALPQEYDPPARIGWLYWKGGKLADAATWTERAIAMVYGPRKARLLNQRADIALAAKDPATERKYREAVVALYESLPAGQQNPDALAQAKAVVAALPASSASATK